MSTAKRVFLILRWVCIWIGLSTSWATEPPQAPPASTSLSREALSENSRLRKSVDFWVNIYSQYSTHQGIIHDTKYIDHIYEVIDFSQGSGKSHGQMIRDAKRRWRSVLLSLHHKQNRPETFTPEENQVFKMYLDVNDPNKFLAAAHPRRLRFQLGQKDRFIQAYIASGRYLPAMEEIFSREGIPVELTRLPFVESSFDLRARSKVGASGIWQFMRYTGKEFMMINDAVDERNDPIYETEAAAKLLERNYDSLKSWPLAVTSYNHGRKGMMRAVRRIGSDDLEDIITEYHSRSFGFASGNFYAELLAVIEVEKNAQKYFGEIPRDRPLSFYEVKLPAEIKAQELARFMRLDLKRIRELNPGLLPSVFGGRQRIPAGYRLRLPVHNDKDKELGPRVFMAGFEQIPAIYKVHPSQREGL